MVRIVATARHPSQRDGSENRAGAVCIESGCSGTNTINALMRYMEIVVDGHLEP